MGLYKKIVDVVLLWKGDGTHIPLFIVIDGGKYKIDRIYKKPYQAASSVGGVGIKYEVRVMNKNINLYYEELHQRWFIESTKA